MPQGVGVQVLSSAPRVLTMKIKHGVFLFIAIFVVLIIVWQLSSVSLKGINVGRYVNNIASSVMFPFIRGYRVAEQKKGFDYRQKNPPSSEQISQMETNRSACFHNDDCISFPEQLVDCNSVPANKYYCNKNSCITTMIGCPSIHYMRCELHECVKKSIFTSIINN